MDAAASRYTAPLIQVRPHSQNIMFPDCPILNNDLFKIIQTHLDFTGIKAASMVCNDWKNRFRAYERRLFPKAIYEVFGDRLHSFNIVITTYFPQPAEVMSRRKLYKGHSNGYTFIGFNNFGPSDDRILSRKLNRGFMIYGKHSNTSPDEWKLRSFTTRLVEDSTFDDFYEYPDQDEIKSLKVLTDDATAIKILKLSFEKTLPRAVKKPKSCVCCVIS